MAVAAVCEFNPFHNGHAYFVNAAKKACGEEFIAIMSGSFTQRGEAAITDKFSRTQAALNGGADLVVELPTVCAVANAERFARGGVAIAKAFRCVNYLAFGCETDDISLLNAAADSISRGKVQEIIKKEMSRGGYYPRALEQAVRVVFGNETADVLTTPNNILAVEYIRNLKGSTIKPLPIKRKGAEHDGSATSNSIASASFIRELLRSGENAERFLPHTPDSIVRLENLERAVLYRLRTMTAEDFKRLPDVEEGLENRIADAVKVSGSVDEILARVKTKRYTHARIRRIITCALLGVTEELQSKKPGYARVLGFSENGAELLKFCEFEVITSVAKAVKRNSPNAEFLRVDALATDIAALGYDRIGPCSTDYLTKIIRQDSAF